MFSTVANMADQTVEYIGGMKAHQQIPERLQVCQGWKVTSEHAYTLLILMASLYLACCKFRFYFLQLLKKVFLIQDWSDL